MNRRRFCTLIGGCAATSLWRPESLFASLSGRTYERSSIGFGTTVRLVVQHESKQRVSLVADLAFRELAQIESLMSVYQPGSEISILNRDGELRDPDPMMVEILRRADEFSRQTASAFDVTVQPLWELYNSSAKAQCVPNEQQLRNARSRVGHENILVRDDRIRLRRGATITLNGIAQGFASDRVKGILLEHDIRHALIDMGELAAVGEKAKGEAWQVGIQHPRNEDAYSAVISMQNRSLATSGDYQTTFTNDFRSHHIFDPLTGRSPIELSSVSVLAPSAIEADALSTALMVMGVRRGSELLAKIERVDAMFTHKDGRISATAGFPKGQS